MYITIDDLQKAFSERALIELSNDSTRATEVNQEVLTMAVTHACETVDGYLRSRYTLPLEAVPTIVSHIALQLARYWLYARRPEGRGLPEGVRDTYKQALKELEAIQLGRLHLGIPEVTPDDLLPSVPKFKVKAPERVNTDGY